MEKKDWAIAIEALPHGGYIVSNIRARNSPVNIETSVMLFASTELKDCFKFIEKQLYRPESR